MKKFVFAVLVLSFNLAVSQEPKPASPNLTYYIRLNSIADLKIDGWIMNAPDDKNLKGKSLVINFWRTNCTPCNVGMKKIERLQQDFKDVKNLYFINLVYEDSAKVIASFAKQKLSTSLIVASDKRKITKLRTDGLKQIIYPMSVMIDDSGVVRLITFPQEIKNEDVQKLIDGKLEPFDSFYPQH